MFPRFLLLFISLVCLITVAAAQEPQPYSGPKTEMLRSAPAEGITSYKADGVERRGETTVHVIKASKLGFEIELPVGYTLFTDAIYVVDGKGVFWGPGDITFRLPSVKTQEAFSQIRILYPRSGTDPEGPEWRDVTFDGSLKLERTWSEAAIKERLPNFKTRTLHAFVEDAQYTFLLALRDPTKLRDKSTADVRVIGTGPEELTEGTSGKYEIKVTNKGPDTAMRIVLEARTSLTFVSVESKADGSEHKCYITMSDQRLYCKFPSLEKDTSIDVKIVVRSVWGRKPGPQAYEQTQTWLTGTEFTVRATEQDPADENNELNLETMIYEDQNKGPVIELVSSMLSQSFTGPSAVVPIRVKASDPDGFIKKVEMFAGQKPLGEAPLRSEGEYELIYKDVDFGWHNVTVVATDNLGRVASIEPRFFVNGPAKVEITSPKAGAVLNTSEQVTLTIHATSPSPLKKVSLNEWDSDATPVGNDNYVVKLRACPRKCRLQAVAIDEKDVETRSEFVEFTLASPPVETKVMWYDAEYIRELENDKTLKVNEVMLMASTTYAIWREADSKKVEYFVNGALVCTDNNPERELSEPGWCIWRPSPGKYKLQAVVTDIDGMVGKSEVIEVVIERP